MLEFGKPNERYFAHGVDRGVLYIPGKDDPVVWQGITGVDEAGDASQSVLYRDGRIYLADVIPGDFSGTLTALFYPDEFAECLGIPEIADGLYADNQKPKRFGLSYRTLIGSGHTGDMFGYQIHIIYNVMAMIGTRSRKTMNESPQMTEFTFDLTATPINLPGIRPTAHLIIDTRNLDKTTLQMIENGLYGSPQWDWDTGGLPDPAYLFDLLNFGDSVMFTDHGNGTWTARGGRGNLEWITEDTWSIGHVNGTNHGDGTYTMQDTPRTPII